MAKMVLSMDGLVLKEIPLNKERLTIGRKPHNDIQIDNLAISGEHAVVVTILNDSFLEDLNSTNGTLVNGQPITRHVLKNNDIVELGKYKLKYMADSNVALMPETQLTRTNLEAIRTQELEVMTESQPGFRPPSLRPAVIQLLNGPQAGKEVELTKTLTTLGKPGVQVAVIARRPTGYFVTHVEGVAVPMVNGSPVSLQAHPLVDHDVLDIAGIKMEFYYRGA